MEYNVLITVCEHLKDRANELGKFIFYMQFCSQLSS